MQAQNYTNFNEDKSVDQVAIGVPITLPTGQMPNPYFQQPLNIYQNNMQGQGYYQYPNQIGQHNQNSTQPRIAHMPIINPPMVIPQPQTLDYSKPLNIRCPCCSMQVTTIVNNESGNTTYLWAGLICCLVSPCCACLPFMTDKCMDKNHYCSNCGFNILRKHRGFIECP